MAENNNLYNTLNFNITVLPGEVLDTDFLIARTYIFWCSQKKTDPKIGLRKIEIKMKYIEQEHLSRYFTVS